MTTSITVIIVDDEKDAREGLERLIKHNLPEIDIIATSENAQNALEIIITEKPKLVLLDIQMPVKDGFWLANKLQKIHNDTDIIFITAYDDYAMEAIRYSAFDFITKPVDPSILIKTINRYKLKKEQNNIKLKFEKLKEFLQKERIKFPTDRGFIIKSPEEILYCESDLNKTIIFFTNSEKKSITLNIDEMENILSNHSFVRINNSVLINLEYLEAYNRSLKTVVIAYVILKHEFKVSPEGVKKMDEI